MRLLADFAKAKEANARCDYLETEGIESEVRSGKKHALWVLDDDLVERAEALLENFDDKADHASAASKSRKAKKTKAKPMAKATTSESSSYSTTNPLTLLMIAASVLVAFTTDIGAGYTDVLAKLLVVPAKDASGGYINFAIALDWNEPWRFFTPMFIHFGFIHIAFNMMWLYRFGNQIESLHGTFTLIGLACVAQFAGSMLQYHISGPYFGGMSGVNYALFGFVWMQSKYGQRGYGIQKQDTLLLMAWLVVCATGLIGPVANAAHSAGLAVGLAAGLPSYLRFRREHKTVRSIEKGSWADLNLEGWQRFDRQYVQPYVPLWFMAIAIAVLVADMV